MGMQLEEKHSAFEPQKLGFEVQNKSVFQQFGPIEEFYLFLSNPEANNYPIVLVGDWGEINISNSFLASILNQYKIDNSTVVFIAHLGDNDYELYFYTKKSPEEIPLFHLGPIHSAHLLNWSEKSSGIIHINYDDIQRKVSENVANIQK